MSGIDDGPSQENEQQMEDEHEERGSNNAAEDGDEQAITTDLSSLMHRVLLSD